MNDDDLVLIDETRSVQWNYVNRVERELASNNQYQYITMNPLLPRSYKEIMMIVSKACNHSRVALLIDNEENYVAFMMVLEEDYIPFLLDGLDDVETPTRCVYKVFPNTELACSSTDSGELRKFIESVVIPDLNGNFDSWKPFKYSFEQK